VKRFFLKLDLSNLKLFDTPIRTLSLFGSIGVKVISSSYRKKGAGSLRPYSLGSLCPLLPCLAKALLDFESLSDIVSWLER
jgi:hypothetical protein